MKRPKTTLFCLLSLFFWPMRQYETMENMESNPPEASWVVVIGDAFLLFMLSSSGGSNAGKKDPVPLYPLWSLFMQVKGLSVDLTCKLEKKTKKKCRRWLFYREARGLRMQTPTKDNEKSAITHTENLFSSVPMSKNRKRADGPFLTD